MFRKKADDELNHSVVLDYALAFVAASGVLVGIPVGIVTLMMVLLS